MFFLIKKLLLLSIIIICAWIPGRDLLEEKYVDSQVGRLLDEAAYIAQEKINYGLNFIFPANNITKIVELSAEQIGALVRVGTKYDSAMLLYVYSLDCVTCKINFDDINRYGKSYDKKDLLVIAVGVANNKVEFADYLDNKRSNFSFSPIMLKPGQKAKLRAVLRRLGTNYSKAPYIGIKAKGSNFINVSAGGGKSKRIKSLIDRAVKQSHSELGK